MPGPIHQPRILCRSCRFYEAMPVRIAGKLTTSMHCRQGVPSSGKRTICAVYQRDPGADDE